MGSKDWAEAMASAFAVLNLKECAEVIKPEWWNDEELKALSARIVRAAPNNAGANRMRAVVLSGCVTAWEAGPRSAAELKKAAVHFDRAAALCMNVPALRAELVGEADRCRSRAATMRFLYTEVPAAASPSKAGAAPLLLGTALALAVTVTVVTVLAARAVARK